jgi:dTDP-glucose pyrophosphorylase
MAKNPTLIVMAAGMGSRYGGLKQIDPVTDKGEIIIDFSLYDALMAGFENVIFIIKKEMEKDVRALMDEGAGGSLDIKYAYQSIDDTPQGAVVPEGREKPWGTGHAVLAARKFVDGPFAVVNADDYYGPAAYQLMHEYLADAKDDDKLRYAMVGYTLSNTITEHGSVTRGVCRTDGDGYLADIEERYNITRRGEGISYEGENGRWIDLPPDPTVSMNFWGFTESFMRELEDGLAGFFEKDVTQNPAKAEYLLPSIVGRLVTEGKASVKIMDSRDRWYGVTYREDKEQVVSALQSLKDRGVYPDKLWK